MGFADEMMNLGEKLVTSCENRMHAVSTNRDNTRKMVNKFHQDNRHMARELKNNLNEFRENLESNTNKMVCRFRNEHKEMSKSQNKRLEEFTDNLAHNVKEYMKKCNKTRMGLHDMFAQAHKNFLHCMREIERKKKHPSAKFECEEPRKTPRKKKRTRH